MGRNLIYILSRVVYLAFILGSALAPNLGTQLTCQFPAGLGASTILSIHATSIADIFGPEGRSIAWPFVALATFLGSSPDLTSPYPPTDFVLTQEYPPPPFPAPGLPNPAPSPGTGATASPSSSPQPPSSSPKPSPPSSSPGRPPASAPSQTTHTTSPPWISNPPSSPASPQTSSSHA